MAPGRRWYERHVHDRPSYNFMSILMTEYKYRLGSSVSTTKLIILFRVFITTTNHTWWSCIIIQIYLELDNFIFPKSSRKPKYFGLQLRSPSLAIGWLILWRDEADFRNKNKIKYSSSVPATKWIDQISNPLSRAELSYHFWCVKGLEVGSVCWDREG